MEDVSVALEEVLAWFERLNQTLLEELSDPALKAEKQILETKWSEYVVAYDTAVEKDDDADIENITGLYYNAREQYENYLIKFAEIEEQLISKKEPLNASEKEIDHYALSDENSELDCEALDRHNRCENERLLTNDQVQKLLTIPIVCRENAADLNQLYCQVTGCLNELQQLGHKVEYWDPLLIPIIVSKLPPTIISSWEQSLLVKSKVPTWTHLSQFILKRIQLLESSSGNRVLN